MKERVESDHMPVYRKLEYKIQRGRIRLTEKTRWLIKWNEESIKRYEKVTRKKVYEDTSMKDRWKEIKGTIEDGVTKVKRKVGEILKNKSWWDKECGRKKREIRKLLKKWKEGKEVKEKYLRERTEFRKICEEAKRGG